MARLYGLPAEEVAWRCEARAPCGADGKRDGGGGCRRIPDARIKKKKWKEGGRRRKSIEYGAMGLEMISLHV